MRVSRSDGSRTYNYIYNGSSLSQMTVDGHTLYFTYDASGRPLSVTYDTIPYFYATNLQGDVAAILDSSGNTVVAYAHDAWGNVVSITGSLSGTLGFYNPLRYRGYVYDAEYGLYYLQSRYYEPLLGRFQSSDAFASTGQGLLGNNMFAYCLNNPVNYVDPSGTASKTCLHDFTEPDSPWKDSSSGGGRAYRDYRLSSNYYGEVADKFYSIRLIRAAGNGLKKGGKLLWDTYQRWYELENEAVMRQAQMTLDMFDSPEDIERSIDIIESTVGFSISVYKVATSVTVANPSVGAVVWSAIGVFWAGRAVYRALQ